MEVRNDNLCIKVDNKDFVLNPKARMTLDGMAAYLCCVMETQDFHQMNMDMLMLIKAALGRHEQRRANEDKSSECDDRGW